MWPFKKRTTDQIRQARLLESIKNKLQGAQPPLNVTLSSPQGPYAEETISLLKRSIHELQQTIENSEFKPINKYLSEEIGRVLKYLKVTPQTARGTVQSNAIRGVQDLDVIIRRIESELKSL